MFGRAVTIISGLALIGLGVAFHLWPQWMGSFVHFQLPDSTSQIEIGTFYGGFEIGAGVMCLLTLRSQRMLVDGLLYQSILYLFSWVCRLIGMLRLHGEDTIIHELLALEFTAFALTALAWLKERKRSA